MLRISQFSTFTGKNNLIFICFKIFVYLLSNEVGEGFSVSSVHHKVKVNLSSLNIFIYSGLGNKLLQLTSVLIQFHFTGASAAF